MSAEIPPPFIFTPSRIRTALANRERFSWARDLANRMEEKAREAAEQPESVLREWFYESTPNNQSSCPECGAYWLNYIWNWSPETPDRLVCDVCGAVVSEETHPSNAVIHRKAPNGKTIPHPVHRDAAGKTYPIQQTIAFKKADHAYAWIEALGVTYALEPEAAYVRAATLLLHRLAEVYPGYILHDNFRFDSQPWGWAGKLTGWHMQDAQILIRLASTWDLIRHAEGVTSEDRSFIEENLFQAAGRMLTSVRPLQGISNDVLYRFGAVALLGRLLEEDAFLDWVLESDENYSAVLDQLFFKDGAWHERSLSYHSMMTNSAWMAPYYLQGYRGQEIINHPKLEPIGEIQFLMRYPDGNLPPVNDGRLGSRPSRFGTEGMFILKNSDKWLAYTNVACEGSLADEGDLLSLFNRPPDIEERLRSAVFDPSIPTVSKDYTGFALFMLRRGSGDHQTVFTLHHHKFANSHSHYDALSTTLWADGREMLCDIGYALFGIKERSTWYMASLSHNTLTVDTLNQRAPNGVANFIYHGDHFSACEGESWDSYRFICEPFARQVALIDAPDGRPYALDIFRGGGGDVHDWALHADTNALQVSGVSLQPEKAFPGKDYAYSEISDVQAGPAGDRVRATWLWEDGARLEAILAGQPDMTLHTGSVPGMRVKEQRDRRIHSLFLRRSGNALRSNFVAVYDPRRDRSCIDSVQILESSPEDHWAMVIRVDLQDGSTDLIFSAYIDVAPTSRVFEFESLSIPWESRFGVVRIKEKKIRFSEWSDTPMEGLAHDI